MDDHPSSPFKRRIYPGMKEGTKEGRKEGRKEFKWHVRSSSRRYSTCYGGWWLDTKPRIGVGTKGGPMGFKLLARWKQLGDFKRGWLWEEWLEMLLLLTMETQREWYTLNWIQLRIRCHGVPYTNPEAQLGSCIAGGLSWRHQILETPGNSCWEAVDGGIYNIAL